MAIPVDTYHTLAFELRAFRLAPVMNRLLSTSELQCSYRLPHVRAAYLKAGRVAKPGATEGGR